MLHHIAGVDGLGVLALLTDGLKGLADGHILPQTDVLGGHQAAGRALGVVQELVQALTGLAGGFFQNPLDHAGGHILQQVGGVVQAHLLDGGDELHIREGFHQVGLGVLGHIGECLGGHLFFQEAEHHQAVVLVQLFQQLGQVGGLFVLGDLPEFDVLLFHQQLEQAALGQPVGVGGLFGLTGSLPGFLFFGLPDVLFQVLGGLLVQVLLQLAPHLGGDIGGQLLGGHHLKVFQLLASGELLFFLIHWVLPP